MPLFPWKNKLIRIAPAIWLSRLHIVLGVFVVAGYVIYRVARILPITSNYITWFAIPLFFGIVPTVRWMRFQYHNYQPYYSVGGLYRLFLCNILASLLITLLVFLGPMIMYHRMWELKNATNGPDPDINQMKWYALNLCERYIKSEGDTTFIATSENLKNAPGWHELPFAILPTDSQAAALAKYYQITSPLPDHPNHAVFSSYCRNIDSLESNFLLVYNEDEFVFFYALVLLTTPLVLSTFLLNLVIARRQTSFFSPFLVSLIYGAFLLLSFPFARHANDPQAYCYEVLLILPIVFASPFFLRRRNLITTGRTFCLQSLSYCLIMLSILWPLYFLNGQFAAHITPINPPYLKSLVNALSDLKRGCLYFSLSLFLACGFGLLYIRWYLAYSLKPYKRY